MPDWYIDESDAIDTTKNPDGTNKVALTDIYGVGEGSGPALDFMNTFAAENGRMPTGEDLATWLQGEMGDGQWDISTELPAGTGQALIDAQANKAAQGTDWYNSVEDPSTLAPENAMRYYAGAFYSGDMSREEATKEIQQIRDAQGLPRKYTNENGQVMRFDPFGTSRGMGNLGEVGGYKNEGKPDKTLRDHVDAIVSNPGFRLIAGMATGGLSETAIAAAKAAAGQTLHGGDYLAAATPLFPMVGEKLASASGISQDAANAIVGTAAETAANGGDFEEALTNTLVSAGIDWGIDEIKDFINSTDVFEAPRWVLKDADGNPIEGVVSLPNAPSGGAEVGPEGSYWENEGGFDFPDPIDKALGAISDGVAWGQEQVDKITGALDPRVPDMGEGGGNYPGEIFDPSVEEVKTKFPISDILEDILSPDGEGEGPEGNQIANALTPSGMMSLPRPHEWDVPFMEMPTPIMPKGLMTR